MCDVGGIMNGWQKGKLGESWYSDFNQFVDLRSILVNTQNRRVRVSSTLQPFGASVDYYYLT